MHQDSGGSDVLGIISVVAGVIGLIGQGCCCIPIISMFASIIVPLCILTSIVTGAIGVFMCMSSERSSTMSWMGLGLGLFDMAVICLIYGSLICGYFGLVIVGAAANA